MPEREERPHREQVAAVLPALDVPEVPGRRPRVGDVAEEPGRVDVQVDLRVRRRLPGPLEERDREREHGEREDEGSVSAAGRQGGEDTAGPDTVPDFMRRFDLVLAVPVLLGPAALAFAKGGYFDVPRLVAGVVACALVIVVAARDARPIPRSAYVAVGGLAALTAWTGVSILWAPIAGAASDDFQRLLLYLFAFVAAVAGPAPARGAAAGRARGAGGHRRRGALRPVRAPAAGRLLAPGPAVGRRPPRLAADLLERDGRAGGHGPRARGLDPVARRGGDRPDPRPRLLPDVLARRARRDRRRPRRPRRAGADASRRPAASPSSPAQPRSRRWRPSRCPPSRRRAGARRRAPR